jgi:hypothetical protein
MGFWRFAHHVDPAQFGSILARLQYGCSAHKRIIVTGGSTMRIDALKSGIGAI